jgi:hypothetical protein
VSTIAAIALLLVVLGSIGRLVLPLVAGAGTSTARAVILAVLGGAVVHHLAFDLMSLLGWRWRIAPVLVAGLVLASAAWWITRGRVAPLPIARPTAALAVSLVAALGLAAAGVAMAVTNPDFIFHWAYKASRFSLDGWVDPVFLRCPCRWYVQPDYPQLIPALLTSSSLLGGFDPGPLTLWSSLCVLALPFAVRDGLTALGVGHWMRETGTVLVTLVVVAFGIVALLPGSVDVVLALLLVLAVPPLLQAGPARSATFELGLLAAVAAAAKVEGVILGVLLLVVRAARARDRWALFAAAPLVVVVSLHQTRLAVQQLVPTFRVLDLDLERLSALPAAIGEWYPSAAWFGFDLVLLATPLLLLGRIGRPVVLVVLGMLGADLAAWALAPFELSYFVAATLPRLELQVLPAVLVLALAHLDLWGRRD